MSGKVQTVYETLLSDIDTATSDFRYGEVDDFTLRLLEQAKRRLVKLKRAPDHAAGFAQVDQGLLVAMSEELRAATTIDDLLPILEGVRMNIAIAMQQASEAEDLVRRRDRLGFFKMTERMRLNRQATAAIVAASSRAAAMALSPMKRSATTAT